MKIDILLRIFGGGFSNDMNENQSNDNMYLFSRKSEDDLDNTDSDNFDDNTDSSVFRSFMQSNSADSGEKLYSPESDSFSFNSSMTSGEGKLFNSNTDSFSFNSQADSDENKSLYPSGLSNLATDHFFTNQTDSGLDSQGTADSRTVTPEGSTDAMNFVSGQESSAFESIPQNEHEASLTEPGQTFSAPEEEPFTPGQTFSAPEEELSTPEQSFSVPEEEPFTPGQTFSAPEEVPFMPGQTFSAPDGNFDGSEDALYTQDAADGASDDESDSAFPLFLSFKANDSMQNISDAVREKNARREFSDDQASASLHAPKNNARLDTEDEINSFDIDRESLNKPIFVPLATNTENHSASYDIPTVFSGSKYEETPVQAPAATPSSVYPNAASDNENQASARKSSDTVTPSSTIRPGARYSAAQQMGYTEPLSLREHKAPVSKKKKSNFKPLLIMLLIFVVIIAGLTAWGKYGDMLSGGSESRISASTAAAVLETTAEATEETSAAAAAETTKETTAKPTSTPAPTSTPSPTPVQTVTPAETTAAETTAGVAISAMTPSGFSAKIISGSSDGSTAAFTIRFTNSGGNDVSLFDGVEYITISFNTSVKITSAASADFTFTAVPDKANTFTGVPVNKDVIVNRGTKDVVITAASDGASIGKYTVNYFVKCYS